ncbi:MFS transporter [Cronobacter turicensis]|jgi:UMF2 family putative MFS family transporter|uniref:MFS transporter n=1 Tax=Cronobacter turicensis TaxID=413502 RepID=UPI0013762EE6|nr:MFS transporter [Cronobacter turicensis]EGT5682335.1 MFS transporter [Cronobacter turicensis]EGT5739168.1 MFS transporter [Cronobacter turicensis]EKM0376668.1 MFS transporter [Cronobacter turicensis]EKM0533356.1 MFS transporter [Cronobacter turicensis]EKM5065425.1 MFS transporter [Cronobacter turicensis]
MSIYTRPVVLLLCGLLLLTLAIAVLNTLVPLWLAHDNLPTWQVGMVGSSYFTGNLLGTLITGTLIKRYGFNRSYYIASLIFAAGCAGLGVTLGFWSWLAWRFIAGVGCAMIWVVVESALMCSGTARNRGRLLAAYMMVYYLGTVAGQLMVSKLPTDLMSVLPWVTGMVMAAILPLLFTRIVNSSSEHQEKTHVWPMFKLRQARLGVNGCIISGIVLGSLYGLMPLYLNHQGVSDSGIGFWMAVMVSAGIIGQWPIGKLADRFGRLLVLRVQVFVVIVGCMAMLAQAAMAPALFVLGAAGFTLYPVAMAWACEKVEHHQLVAMNQALLLSYTIGSLLGPTFTAMLMQSYSDSLLFVMIASVSFVYLMMLMRKAGHHPTPVAHA